MHLLRIQTDNFRNLAALDCAFEAAPVVFWGENGQGKSNLLEAIGLGCSGGLWGAGKEDEAIAWTQQVARVKAEVQAAGGDAIATEVALARGARPLFKINGVKRKRSDFLGLVPLVSFGTEDIAIVKGEPTRRRAFLNREIGQISRSYYWNSRHYLRALEQRNRLLKESKAGRGASGSLATWEEALARHGGKIVETRAAFLRELQGLAEKHLLELHPGWSPLWLDYRPALGGTAQPSQTEELPDWSAQEIGEALLRGFGASRAEEIARGYSLVGPQRDDFEVKIGEADQRIYGSQGQQRSLAIALRLGLMEKVRQSAQTEPILLLDDIFSELDRERREGLLRALGTQRQYFLTSPTLEEVPAPLLEGPQVYLIREGRVQPHAA